MCYVCHVSTVGAEARWIAHRRIFTNAATVGALIAAVKVGGAVKVAVTARFFGASDELDAYLIAFALLAFLSEVVCGAFIPSFVPALIGVRSARGLEAARPLAGEGLGFVLAAMMAVSAAVAVGGRAVLPLLASGFSPEKLALTNLLMWGLLLWLPMAACCAAWRAVLNAHEVFAVPAAAALPGPLIAIAFLYAGAAHWGAGALAAATVLGVAVEAAILGWAVRRLGYPLRPAFAGWSHDLAGVRRQYARIIAAVVIVSGGLLVDQAVAASMGSGSVSMLAYGTKLCGVLVAIGATAVATALLPEFSRCAHQQDWPRLRHAVRVSAGAVVLLMVPVTALLMATSRETVRLYLERGAFDAAETVPVAVVQQWALLQVPVAMLAILAVRLANALSANALVLRAGAAAFAVNAAADLVLSRLMGVAGIALAGALAQAVLLAGLAAMLYRREPRLFRAGGAA
jgi:putative peptidoglycan lipid II flippase